MNRREFIGAAALGLSGVACASSRDESLDRPAKPANGTDTMVTGSSLSDPASTPPAASSAPPSAPWSAADFGAIDSFAAATHGDALRIVEGGEVVHEWYRDGDPSFSRDVFSAQKSVVSLLVGQAVDRGMVSIDTTVDSVLGTDWGTGDTSTITVAHLLSMTSGLNDALRVIDMPGNAWRYNNAYAVLFDVIVTATGREINDVAAEWLFDPIGATGATFEPRPNAVVGASFGLVCTATELASIGMMVLGRGAQPVSRTWLAGSFEASQQFNAAYGRLWWLNGQSTYMVPEGRSFEGSLIPHAPSDTIAALGKDDQKLYVCPSLDLVVTRLGLRGQPQTRLALSTFDDELWTLLVEERERTA